MSPSSVESKLPRARFLLVTGKGGVGKTTVAATLARAYEAEGKRVLICMCNAKDRLSALLKRHVGTALGASVVPMTRGIWAVNMNPDAAIEEYGMLTLKSRALYKVLFDNRYVRSFLRAVPGLQDWSMLGKAWWHTTEQDSTGQLKYDVVILDAPATGHGLDMLRVPKVIVDVVPPGLLRRDAEAAWTMFRDPTQAGVVLVTLPEEMPVTESIELLGAVRSELGLPIAKVIVNAALPELFSAEERTILRAQPNIEGASPAAAALHAGALRALREDLQREAIDRLAPHAGMPLTRLPLVLEGAASPDGIDALLPHLV